MSKRAEIVAAILAAMTGITVAAGYQTNLGANAHLWNVDLPREGELPFVDVRDLRETYMELPSRMLHHDLTVELVATIEETATANFRMALADIHKALGVDRTLGGKVRFMVPTENETAMTKDKKKIATVTQRLHVQYQTQPFNEDA